MSGQDQLIPNQDRPSFQVSPLVPTGNSGALPVVPPTTNASQPQQSQVSSQDQVSVPAPSPTSADAGVGLLRDIFASKEQTIQAYKASMTANAAVDDAATQQMMKVQDHTLSSFDNLKRIERWDPVGISGIMGLFDSDWNADYQKLNLASDQVAASQIKDRADAMHEVNNRAPALAKLSGDLSQAAYTAYATERTNLREDQKLAIDATRLKMEMADAGRKAEADAIEKLTGTQARQALKDAQSGKGPYVGMDGLLTQHIRREEKADVELGQLRVAAREENEKAVADHLDRLAGYIPPGLMRPLVQDALKNNSAFVTVPIGKNEHLNIPLPVAQSALARNDKTEESNRQQAAAQVMADTQFPSRLMEALATSSAMSTHDPRAAHESTILHQSMIQLGIMDNNGNFKSDVNYENVRQAEAALTASEARLKTITADVSKTFTTPEAQQAIVNYGANGGKFTGEGASAVMKDQVGNFGANNSSRYSTVYASINQSVAAKLQQQGGSGFSFGSRPLNNTDMMAILTANKENKKRPEIIDQVLNDPAIADTVINGVTTTIKPQILTSVIGSLAQEKNANPVWNMMIQNVHEISEVDPKTGRDALSIPKIAEFLEKRSLETGYKTNYAQAFYARVKKYGIVADNNANRDPSYSMLDRALEAKYFGGSPHGSVASALLSDLIANGEAAHREAVKRIQEDVSGKTKRDAALQNAAFLGPDAPIVPVTEPLPSATGAHMTDDQISQLFGGLTISVNPAIPK